MSSMPVRGTTTGGAALTARTKGVLKTATVKAGSATTTLVLYDDPDSADGNVLLDVSVLAGDTLVIDFDRVPFNAGLWYVLTGAGTPSVVAYIE